MGKWLCLFFCAFSCLFSLDIKERLAKAKSGDYIVTEANKMITLIAIRSITPQSIVLEEISAPLPNLKERPTSWPEWVKAKAPGHTSWSMIEIDLQNSQILECFSFSRSAWIQLSQKESLLATLLNLPLHKAEHRRRIGPAPMAGEADHRKIWNPPLVCEGKKKNDAQFDVFETTWPQDSSELAGKKVSLYFDREKQFPLPFWIEVETSHATAALRTIDSGKNLPSLHRHIPRRVPEFVGQPQKTKNGLRLSLKSPKYYRQFELFAIDITTREKQICPVTYSLSHGDGELLTLEIDEDELSQTLQSDHRYTWLLVPVGHSESYTESSKPFLWAPSK
jgi:hypothetical protein